MAAKIVTASKSADVVESILADGHQVYAAVAYWNGGAAQWFADRAPKKTKIAVDVNAGGTSPQDLKTLMERFPGNVRVHSDLHAKIYAIKGKALIGSQNASAPGLQFDGKSYARIEAGWLQTGSDATACFKFAKKIYEKSVPATCEHVEICEKRFGRRPLAAQDVGKLDIFTALFEHPEIFDNMPVLASVSNDADEAVLQQSLERAQSNEDNGGLLRDLILPKNFYDAGWDWYHYDPEYFPDPKTYNGKYTLGLHLGPRKRSLHLGLVLPHFVPGEKEVLHLKNLEDRSAWPLLKTPNGESEFSAWDRVPKYARGSNEAGSQKLRFEELKSIVESIDDSGETIVKVSDLNLSTW